MNLQYLWPHGTKTLLILFLTLFLTQSDLSWGSQLIRPHHHLTMTLHPDTHTLTAEDTITFHNPVGLPEYLELTLNRHLVIDEILLNNSYITFTENLNKQYTQDEIPRLRIPLHDKRMMTSSPSVTIRYHGMIADHPKGTPGLRFTKPDKTTGYIGPEGVYLTSETQWFPSIIDGLATFHLRAIVPSGWESVTQGKEVSHVVSQGQTVSEWNISSPSETLTVAANRFIKKEREWNGITVGTYLFPEDAQLANQYLDATVKYLTMYTKLLGPYPFAKFVVVENFFPSGIGLPSFTLLGNRIIQRGYTQPYSLGHEIVHSWFGNSVFNHFSTGNWVEGLTTYLSNYYYEEVHALAGTALKKRQQMFFEYNLYATQEQEYPIRKFHHKETRIDNAIGYQKTAMLFHM
ncbi:MAG: M1 family metallopeptidase, partial [Nitrospirales bacterium]